MAYQLQAESADEVSPSSVGLHYRHNSDAAFAPQQIAQSDDTTSDKDLVADEEKQVVVVEVQDEQHASSGIYINTHITHTAAANSSHSDRKRDRSAEEREERREEKEKAREDSIPSARRQASPLPPPASARRPSLHTPPPQIPQSASPLPNPHQHVHHHGAHSPSPPPPPPPPPQPPSFLHLRRLPQPPLRSLPISLKNKPTRERQQTIHRLLSGSGNGKEPTSISSPEYEFSDAESSTRSQPRTPSSARHGKERETPAELMFVKEVVTHAQDTLPPTSTLTSSLQGSQPPTYTRQTRTGLLTSAAIKGQRAKITIFLPVNDMVMWLEVGAASAAEMICRIVLDVYRKENANCLDARMLDSVRCYQLFIAEEDGCVDEDFPGLDPSAVIGSTGSTHFALHHVGEPASGRAGRPRGSPTLSFNPRPSISNSLSLSDERGTSANASGGGSAEGSMSAAADVRHAASGPEQTGVGQGMSAFETESGEALVKRPWYSKLLCCGLDEEGWGDANDLSRRRSRGDSVGGMASPNIAVKHA